MPTDYWNTVTAGAPSNMAVWLDMSDTALEGTWVYTDFSDTSAITAVMTGCVPECWTTVKLHNCLLSWVGQL